MKSIPLWLDRLLAFLCCAVIAGAGTMILSGWFGLLDELFK